MMGSSLRRLWLYYSHNIRKSHILTLVAVVCFLLWMFGSPFQHSDKDIVKSKYGIVRYKKVKEPEKMSASDIKKTLESLVDTRPVFCRDSKYDFTRLEPTQSVSIILSFHGQSFYDLKLTLNSIVEYTPYDLYTEIIILDDGTTDDRVPQEASSFLHDSRFNKAKIYRSESHDGQSASWFKSSKVATGDLLVFVDTTVIVNQGWLQPLLSKIIDEEDMIAVPHADNILDDDRFFRTEESLINVATWALSTVYFESRQSSVRDQSGETVDTPVSRGDVIAIRKSYLESLGGLDEGLREDDGRGQHIELSLRAWLCGGSVRIVSCSHVAVRNSFRPRRISNAANYRRIVELWFDGEHKTAAQHQGELMGISSALPHSEQEAVKIRRNALQQTESASKCRPFSWYISDVATPIVTPSDRVFRFGKLRAKTNYCVRMAPSSQEIEMELCREYMYEIEAMFEMNADGSIFRGDRCLAPDKSGRIVAALCDDEDPEQKWHWTTDGRLTVESRPGFCLVQVSERDQNTMELNHHVQLKTCSPKDATDLRKELWKFLSY